MSFLSLTTAQVASGKAVKTSTMDQIKDNFDDLDSRIGAVSDNITIWNELVNFDTMPQGTMMWSFLTEAQFQAQMGSSWVLVDASAGTYIDPTSGSTRAIPDASRRFLYNRGDQSTDFEGTTVDLRDQIDDKTAHPDNPFTMPGGIAGSTPGALNNNNTSTYTLVDGGDNATRPDAVVANLFIKSSEALPTKRLVYRANTPITLNVAKVTQLIAGVSGTLEIDVKKGSNLSSLTTIFSTKPSVGFASGDYATSTNAVFSDTGVSANDWLVVDVTGVQNGGNKFHIQLEGILV